MDTKPHERPAIDHAARIIEQCFEKRGNDLWVGGLSTVDLADAYGTPLFVYDRGVILNKIRQVREILPSRFELYYSIKANPNAQILKLFLEQDCGLEVASGGELYQAIAAGCPPDRLIFAGPGKTEDELRAAVAATIREIHVESIDEARWIDRLAKESQQIAKVALRVNPTDAAGGAMRMGGQASPFGIDEEVLPAALDEILSLEHVHVSGVHLFMGTQILDAKILLAQYERAVAIADRVALRLNRPLESIDFGGGLGTPYFSREQELDLEQVAEGLEAIASSLDSNPLLAEARAIVEPGRFLVAEAGVYVSRVTRVKISRGKTFVVIDGGMHHHLAASGNLGQTIKRNFPVVIANRLEESADQPLQIVGPLCTPLDCLSRNADLPAVEPGDLVVIFQSGAYARTSSPHGFLSHNTPAEILVADGEAALIRRRGQPSDYLLDQVFEGQGKASWSK